MSERGVRVLRDGDGKLLVLGTVAMRALAENAAVGGAPVEFLTGWAGDRTRRATGAVPPGGAQAFDAFLGYQVFTMNPPVHAGVRRSVS